MRAGLVDENRLSTSRDQVFACTRTSLLTVLLNPSSGINSSGFYDLSIDFSLSEMNLYVGGTVSNTVSIPGSTDFTALFEMWKIDKVELSMMFSSNAVSPGTITAPTSPILVVAFDPNDTSVTSLNSLLQVNGNRIIQIANIRGESGYTTSFVPRCKAQSNTVPVTGNGLLMPIGQYISTDSPATTHNGIKMFYDNAKSTYASTIGSLSMYVKLHYSLVRSK